MSSSQSLPAIHPASRVPATLHNPALADLLRLPVSFELIDYVVDYVASVVSAVLLRATTSMSASQLKVPSLVLFVSNVIQRTRAPVGTVLVTLSYLDRARTQMEIAPGQWACERVFLGAFILANKYTNDSWMNSKTWAAATGVFAPRDVVRVEREFLNVLEHKLGFDENALLAHHDAIIARYASRSPFWTANGRTAHIRSAVTDYTTIPSAAAQWQPNRAFYDDVTPRYGSSPASASPLDSPDLMTPVNQLTSSFPVNAHDGSRATHAPSHCAPNEGLMNQYALDASYSDPITAHVPGLNDSLPCCMECSGGPLGDLSSIPPASLLAELLQNGLEPAPLGPRAPYSEAIPQPLVDSCLDAYNALPPRTQSHRPQTTWVPHDTVCGGHYQYSVPPFSSLPLHY